MINDVALSQHKVLLTLSVTKWQRSELLRNIFSYMPQEQRWSKNQGSWPLNGPGHGQTLQQLSAKKNWYNSEMVVFTKIVIISAVSDGFLKFQKF